jgi:hypothetical protein
MNGSARPYPGTEVEKNITFDQNNHFASNTYSNPSYGSLALWNIPQRPVLGTPNQVASLRWPG